MAKVKDLSPKSPILSSFDQLKYEVTPGELPMADNWGGLQMFSQSFKRGYGNNVFGVDARGLWLGGADFVGANFSVDYSGNATLKSVTLTNTTLDDIGDGTTYKKVLGTYISAGKILLSLADGDLDDISDATSTAKKTTATEKAGAGYAYSGLNSDGDVKRYLNAADMTGGDLPANGLAMSTNYMGFRLSSAWTSYIKNDGTFYFKGNASNYIYWNGSALTVRGAITADDITSGTLTGRTVRTSATGYRTELNVSDPIFRFYNGTSYKFWMTSAGALGIATGGLIFADNYPGTQYGSLSIVGGHVTLAGGGAVGIYTGINLRPYEGYPIYLSGETRPGSTSAYALGTSSYRWASIYATYFLNITTANQPYIYLYGTDAGASDVQVIFRNGTRRYHVGLNVGGISSSTWTIYDYTAGAHRLYIASTGAVTIPGALSKGSGTFDIPHPDQAKPQGTRLRHSFVESPTAGDNIYRYSVGTKAGKAQIRLPDYFYHLNENPQVFVSAVDSYSRVRAEVVGDHVLVFSDQSETTVNVLIIGTRKDKVALSHWLPKGIEYNENDYKD